MFKRLREWLIIKLVGNTPIIMNVTIYTSKPIKGTSPQGIFEKCSIISDEK